MVAYGCRNRVLDKFEQIIKQFDITFKLRIFKTN